MCAGSLVMGVRFFMGVSFFMGAIFRSGALQGFAEVLGTTLGAAASFNNFQFIVNFKLRV